MLKSKRLFALLFVTVLFSSLYWAGSHYKYDMYDAAIAFENDLALLTEKRIQVGNLDIAYLEGPRREGEQSILLIHGFGAIKEGWVRFAAQLTDQYHVIAIDLPGHGESTKDLSLNYSIPSQADNVHEIAKALNLNKFHIAGNSMGGAISAIYAGKHPGEIQTVTLFDPAGIHDVESEMMVLLKEGKNPLIVSDTKSFEYLISFVMEKPPFIPWPITEVVAEKASQKQKINAKIFTDFTTGDPGLFKTNISTIKSPTLIVWGDKDRVINVGNADIFEQLILKSKKVILPGIGHVPMIEDPKLSAELMVNLIKKQA